MAPTPRYRSPADLPTELPVFPLRGAILLPRSTLPLNVFEPRYLAMLDDVMSGARVLGILQPAGGDDTESPAGKAVRLRRVGCAGRVTSYQETDDGRLTIALTGVARFDVLDEIETAQPYRVMRVSYERFASDLDGGRGEDQVDRAKLIRGLRSYLERKRLSTDWSIVERASSEFLINALSIMCPYGPEEKQMLLEAVDLKTRAELLAALAEMELAAQGGSGTLQ